MRARNTLLILLLALFFTLAGCGSFGEWWASSSVRDVAEPAVERLEVELAGVRSKMDGLQAEIDQLTAEGDWDEAERRQGELDALMDLESSVTSTIDDAKAEMAGAKTNGDLVLTVGGMASIPWLGTVVSLIRQRKKTAAIVRNVEKAKTVTTGSEFSVNKERLRVLNLASGVDDVVEKIRKGS